MDVFLGVLGTKPKRPEQVGVVLRVPQESFKGRMEDALGEKFVRHFRFRVRRHHWHRIVSTFTPPKYSPHGTGVHEQLRCQFVAIIPDRT